MLPERVDPAVPVVAWSYVPSAVWKDTVLTADPEKAQLARDMGCDVQSLIRLSDHEALIAGLRADNERLRRDAERYRLLRMFELGSGSWPFDNVKAPAGLLAWTRGSNGDGYTQSGLDHMLDDMLGKVPRENVRPDYQEWRARETAARIDAAQAGGDSHAE